MIVTDEPGTDKASADSTSTHKARAVGVETVVVEERGQWAVEIVVIFEDSVVRRRVNTYMTRQRAEISAKLIKRGAEREIGGPVNG